MGFEKGNTHWKKRGSCKGVNNPFYGKHHSEESKKRMGAKKGNIPWNKGLTGIYNEDTLLKMKSAKEDYIPWNKGKKGVQVPWNLGLTKENNEIIARYSEKLKGRDFSKEHRKKISDSRWGEDNPAWSGGNSFYPYSPKFNRSLKKKIAKRDSFTCQLCGEKNVVDSNIHHWNYDKLGEDPFYMVFTCRRCNARLNYNRKSWANYFYTFQLDRGLEPIL